MKKFISIIAALCMLMSMTAFAAITSNAEYYITAKIGDNEVTTAAPGDIITYDVMLKKDTSGSKYLYSTTLMLKYDKNVVEMTPTWCVSGFTGNNTFKIQSNMYVWLQLAANDLSDDFKAVSDAQPGDYFKIATFTGKVLATTGTVKLTPTSFKYVMSESPWTANSTTPEIKTWAKVVPEVTIQSAPADPEVTFDTTQAVGGIVETKQTVNGDEVDVEVTAKAPIGKVAKLTVGGNNTPLADGKYSATVADGTAIVVVFEEVAGSVYTLEDVYKDGTKTYIFGKGTGTNRGFNLTGIAEDGTYGAGALTATVESGAGFFPADGTAEVFAIELNGFTASTAAACVDNVDGNIITIQ